MTHRVYIIKNTVNGKQYVGKTKLLIEERFKQHVYCSEHNSPYLLHSAIRKYGQNSFNTQMLVDDLTSNDASNEEIRLIAENCTYAFDYPDKGYNMTRGGDGVPWTPEIGAKMSASRSGERNPMYGRSGPLNPMFGKNLSESSRTKISASVKAIRAVKPLIVSDETKRHMVESSTRRFAHIVPLHTRVIELRNQGMKYSDVAAKIAEEFGLIRDRKHYAVIFSDHKLDRCKTCLKISSNFTEAAVVGGIVVTG